MATNTNCTTFKSPHFDEESCCWKKRHESWHWTSSSLCYVYLKILLISFMNTHCLTFDMTGVFKNWDKVIVCYVEIRQGPEKIPMLWNETKNMKNKSLLWKVMLSNDTDLLKESLHGVCPCEWGLKVSLWNHFIAAYEQAPHYTCSSLLLGFVLVTGATCVGLQQPAHTYLRKQR